MLMDCQPVRTNDRGRANIVRWQRLPDHSWSATAEFPGGYLVVFSGGVQQQPTREEEQQVERMRLEKEVAAGKRAEQRLAELAAQ